MWTFVKTNGGGRLGARSHDVDIIIEGVVTKWWSSITKWGTGVKNLGKSGYIISERSLTM